MLNLGAGFGVLWCADYAFDGLGEDEVCELVGWQEGTEEGAAVDGDDEDFFCGVLACLFAFRFVSRRGMMLLREGGVEAYYWYMRSETWRLIWWTDVNPQNIWQTNALLR